MSCAVWIQYMNVTDRQTDRQTDIGQLRVPRACVASCGKKNDGMWCFPALECPAKQCYDVCTNRVLRT